MQTLLKQASDHMQVLRAQSKRSATICVVVAVVSFTNRCSLDGDCEAFFADTSWVPYSMLLSHLSFLGSAVFGRRAASSALDNDICLDDLERMCSVCREESQLNNAGPICEAAEL